MRSLDCLIVSLPRLQLATEQRGRQVCSLANPASQGRKRGLRRFAGVQAAALQFHQVGQDGRGALAAGGDKTLEVLRQVVVGRRLQINDFLGTIRTGADSRAAVLACAEADEEDSSELARGHGSAL